MKRKYIILLFCALFSFSGCNFLEVDPELEGLKEEDVFSTYKNYRLYFDYILTKDQSINKLNIHELMDGQIQQQMLVSLERAR